MWAFAELSMTAFVHHLMCYQALLR